MNLRKQNTHIKLYQGCRDNSYRASIMIRETGKPFFFVDTSYLSYGQIMSILGSLIEGLFDEETKEFWENHVTQEFAEYDRKKKELLI